MTRASELFGGQSGVVVPGAGAGANFGGWVNAGAPHITPAFNILTFATSAIAQDLLLLSPFRVAVPHVATHVVFENTSGTRNTRAGLYRVNAAAINLLVESADTALGGTGIQEIDIADTTLSPGTTYLAGIVHSIGSMTYRTIGSSIVPYADFPIFGAISGPIAGVYVDAHAYGALPSTLTFTDNSSLTGATVAPFIRLKVSS